MSRQINWSEPLSDEDRVWAEQRLDMPSGQDGMTIGEKLAANDQEHGKEARDQRLSRVDQVEEARAKIAELQNKIERLHREQTEEDNRNAALAGSLGDQAKGLAYRDQTPVNGQTPEGANTETEDYSDEKYWTKAKLTELIDERNTERQADGLEPLPRTGNRSELVERIRRDDDEIRAAESEGN